MRIVAEDYLLRLAGMSTEDNIDCSLVGSGGLKHIELEIGACVNQITPFPCLQLALTVIIQVSVYHLQYFVGLNTVSSVLL